ncbi:MAG: M1 family aminopeptidase [Gemmatimonadota bacterium]
MNPVARRPPQASAPVALAFLAACAAPAQDVPLPNPTPVPVEVAVSDTARLPGEPPAHAPGRVPSPGPYAPGFDALHYHVALELPERGTVIRATTTVDVALLAPRRDTLRLDLTGLRVTRVVVARGRTAQQTDASFRQADGRLFVALPADARAGDTVRVAVTYDGSPDDGLIIGENVHGRRGAFGDNWPDRARFWIPSIDHPSDKATVMFEVRAPAGWQVVGNGRRVDVSGRPLGTTTAASVAPPADGVWRWRIDQPIPTYLMVIGATPFTTTSIDDCAAGGRVFARTNACVPTGFWSFPEDSANAARIFARADRMLEYYSGLIAPFPYARLAHVQSATRFGGMENAGAIFYSERAIANGTLGEGTVAHEIAHQWFGDEVTPARWADLWLSEGFATYFGALFFEDADGAERFREILRESWDEYLQSQVTDIAVVDTVSTPGNDLLELLNANSYNKGGAVLHMLRGVVGDSAFFGGIRAYYARHAPGNATTADLRRVMEQAAGRDLGWFFEQWLYRPGHPVLRVSREWNQQAGEAVILVEQVQKAGWPVFRLPMQIELQTAGGTVRRHIELVDRRTELRFQLPDPLTGVVLDPDGWVLGVVEQ